MTTAWKKQIACKEAITIEIFFEELFLFVISVLLTDGNYVSKEIAVLEKKFLL